MRPLHFLQTLFRLDSSISRTLVSIQGVMLYAILIMRCSLLVTALLSALVLVNGQVASFCKDDGCVDCPMSLAIVGTGYPECVIYDTETVFGGLGFREGEDDIKYLTHGNFQDLCGGRPGSVIIRSPARLTENGCGELMFSTYESQCSVELAIHDRFSTLLLLHNLVTAQHDVGREEPNTRWCPGNHSSPG